MKATIENLELLHQMYCKSIVLRRLEVFPLPPKTSQIAPLHRYHQHDLLEFIADNDIDFLTRLIVHWGYEDKGRHENICFAALLLYNRIVTDSSSLGLRGIRREPEMSTVTWYGPSTWRYDCMRMENQHFRPRQQLSVMPEYRNSIDKLGKKLNLSFVHPCRYMNWIQFEQEACTKYMWRFAPAEGNENSNRCTSNYYDVPRFSLNGVGINGNFSPLISYGSNTEWITYSCEELEESVSRSTLPLTIYPSGEKTSYEPDNSALESLYDFLEGLQGSIYSPFVAKLHTIIYETKIMVRDIREPNFDNVVLLNILASELRPDNNANIDVMHKFGDEEESRSLFGELVAFTRSPSFQCLQVPLHRVYKQTFDGNMCCSDFAEMLLTTTQVYAGKFFIPIVNRNPSSHCAHIDYYGRRFLLSREDQ